MAQGGQAPRFLGWTSKRGVPVFAIILTNLFGALSMMNVSTGAARAYGYIVNLSGKHLSSSVEDQADFFRCLDFPGLGIHQLHSYPIQKSMEGTRTSPKRTSIPIHALPLERLLRAGREHLFGVRARMEYSFALQRRELCQCIHSATAVSRHLDRVQAHQQDAFLALT